MENKRQVGGVNSSSSSSLTIDLFGPKDSSSSSTSSGLFSSVFGPPSTGLQQYSPHNRPMRKQDFGNQYGNGKHGNSGNNAHNQNKSAEPSCFSSSIYYGGQEVYSPNGHTTAPQYIFKKDGGDDDANGSNLNTASRGNWWQGSLYY